MTVGKTAESTVRPDRRDECVVAVREVVAAVRENEPGTRLYVSFARADDETRFLHVMVFEDEEAERRHRGSDRVRRFTDRLYLDTLERPRFTDFTEVASA
jgi:quinol monooxygenase YgiN